MPRARTTSNMNETFAMTGNGAVKRIRTPHPHDVLSGRGGGINSHVGNKTFREWVRVRKEAYNLAGSKAEKARVANEVIDLVRSQNPPGRFLQRDPSTMSGASWWVEVDEVRALAKTSQALREGAPQIRAAHKDELQERAELARRSKRKKPATSTSHTSQSSAPPTVRHSNSPITSVALESMKKNVEEAKALSEKKFQPQSFNVPPLMSTQQFNERYSNSPKRQKIEDENMRVDQSAETPPLTSVPERSREVPPLKLGLGVEAINGNQGNSSSSNGLRRSHSLALSDISTGGFVDEDEEFVNPFADESDILNGLNPPSPADGKTQSDSNNSNNSYLGRNRPGPGNMNSRSPTELSDLSDIHQTPYETDFGEAMKSVFDAVNPDLTSPEKGDWMPTTLLMPWRGNPLKRGRSSSTPRSTKRGYILGRQ